MRLEDSRLIADCAEEWDGQHEFRLEKVLFPQENISRNNMMGWGVKCCFFKFFFAFLFFNTFIFLVAYNYNKTLFYTAKYFVYMCNECFLKFCQFFLLFLFFCEKDCNPLQ